jgi:hypothetical protein
MSIPRASKLETAERVRYVQELILNDYASGDIIKAIIQKWGVTERQSYRYLWAANAFFEEKNELSLTRKKAVYKARKLKLLRNMDPAEKKTAKGVAAINKVLDSMAKLDGITFNEPDSVKVNVSTNNTVSTTSTLSTSIDYSALSTEFLEAVVNSRVRK